MSVPVSTDSLNDLLINLGRSLLQYTEEAWPWTGPDATSERRTELTRLARTQQDSVRELVELLDSQGHIIDFGVYPAVYTSSHYVSLDFLLDHLVVNQEAVVEDVTAALREYEQVATVHEVLEGILNRERRILERLKELQTSDKAAAAQSS